MNKEYSIRHDKYMAAYAHLSVWETGVSKSRPLVFLLIIITIFLSMYFKLFSLYWIALPTVLFISIVIIHEKLITKTNTIKRLINFYDKLNNRVEHKWIGTGFYGNELLEDNLYANDLDVFGKGSLFERLCLCNNKIGQAKLAMYLQTKPDKEEILQRQEAVKEFTNELLLREQLHLISADINKELEPKTLVAWAEKEPCYNGSFQKNILPVLIKALTGLTILSLLLASLGFISLLFFFLFLLIQQVARLFLNSKSRSVIRPISKISNELEVLSKALCLYENKVFISIKNIKLIETLKSNNVRASVQIKKLDTLKVWLDSVLNPIFAPIAFLLMWEIHFAFAIESWRQKNALNIKSWLNAFGELEAINSISCFAFENPDHIFPVIEDAPMLFHAEQLGHPLINQEDVVCNDVVLDHSNRVFIVSGSNMSGKSTLLRTIGINTVLSFAGAPVKARSLRLSIFDIGAKIRTEDSLYQGISKFYFEISHISKIYKMAQSSSSSLVLLDEVFNGTNSHDRKQGVTALITELIKENALVLITTHDLALTSLDNINSEAVKNIHFSDTFIDGKLIFDYKIKEGIIEKSNAIELMKLVGLPVLTEPGLTINKV